MASQELSISPVAKFFVDNFQFHGRTYHRWGSGYKARNLTLFGERRIMPHVVLNGKVSVERVFNELKPLFVRDEKLILRTGDVYLERGKNAILIDSLAIESDVKTSFLAMITGRTDGIVIRLYPKIGVEKTDGVKKILATVARQLLQTFSEFNIGETNLTEYLK